MNMTLVVAWIRKIGSIEELCIASDSRVTSGRAWDCCPKIKELDRGDCVLAFAGDTSYAYPMMEQASNTINKLFYYHSNFGNMEVFWNKRSVF